MPLVQFHHEHPDGSTSFCAQTEIQCQEDVIAWTSYLRTKFPCVDKDKPLWVLEESPLFIKQGDSNEHTR